MQPVGNLAMYEGHDYHNVVWESNMANPSGCPGPYKAGMKDDGNLVIYGHRDRVVWESHTYRGPGPIYEHIIQDDRNFVIFGGAIWHSHTNI